MSAQDQNHEPLALDMNATKEQVKTTLETVKAIADTIRDLHGVPSGTLYALCAQHMDLQTYNRIIAILKETGLVKEENFFLTWAGPKPEPKDKHVVTKSTFLTRGDAEYWYDQERKRGNFATIKGPELDGDGQWSVTVERRTGV